MHWNAMKQVLGYLSSAQLLGIALKKVCDDSLVRFCDADLTGDRTERPK